ncbi:MAG: EamA family transporter [Thermoleophilia bacterium]|nr:EamA family transporter [Thermoleophilia bacterium]
MESAAATSSASVPRAAIARVPAPALLVAAAFSVQGGAALATTLFNELGTLATVWVRTLFAALILTLLARAGSSARLRRGPLRWAFGLGVALAAVNSLFYLAIARVPLGVAVTVEFLGPLSVAVLGSRRRLDFVWIVLAAAGVVLLASPTVDVDHAGLGLALAAGVFWASYILLGKRLAATWSLQRGLAVSMALAAVLTAPLGIASGGSDLLSARLLALGLAVAILASVVPYALELAALRRLRTSTFGILMSLGPAVAALVGAVFLSQTLGPLELLAIAFVVVASIGANRSAPVDVPEA